MSSPWPGISPRIISRSVLSVNGLDVHILEAIPPTPTPPQPTREEPNTPPLILLLHGFPELAYSWRKIIQPLADAGYHVVAPDQRGYGRTKPHHEASPSTPISEAGRPIQFDDDLAPFRMLNRVTDMVALVYALGYTSAAAVVGHDFGSEVAGYCALVRPDVFRSVVIMSGPFTGPPPLPIGDVPAAKLPALPTNEQLVALEPPRKHYRVYYSTPEANVHMHNPPQGLHAFLRGYYHVKSADWAANQPYHLPSASATHLAVIPHYYIMPLHETMPECVERDAPSAAEIERNVWLPDDELAVYVAEYTRTGFQGGLNRYRCMTDSKWMSDLLVFSRKKIKVPAMFIAGRQDWGVYQVPGAAEWMKESICESMKDEDFVLVEGAGHWVQQEKAAAVVEHLLRFLKRNA